MVRSNTIIVTVAPKRSRWRRFLRYVERNKVFFVALATLLYEILRNMKIPMTRQNKNLQSP